MLLSRAGVSDPDLTLHKLVSSSFKIRFILRTTEFAFLEYSQRDTFDQ